MSYPILFGNMASSGLGEDFVLLDTITVSSPTASTAFSNISQDYKHLQIRLVGNQAGTTNVKFYFQINGVTNNDWATLASYSGTFSGTDNQQDGPAVYFGGTPGGSNSTYRQTSVIDILDYKSKRKHKSLQIHSTAIHSGSGGFTTSYTSGIVTLKSPVTSIVFGVAGGGGGDIMNGTKLRLYGVKG
jgi:hypothetical protein